MFAKIIFGAATVALALASAATKHDLTLYENSVLNGTELKPGDYRLMVDGNTATLKRGKQIVQVPVKVETADRKFSADSIRYTEGGRISEISIGGTNMKLVVESAGAEADSGTK